MTTEQAILLGIVEGITEFLPISSTGHMIIVSSLMGIAEEDFTKLFTVAVQLGAILSVVVLYWKRFFQSIDFYVKLIIAFIPAVIAGVLLKNTIHRMLGSPMVVGYSLLIGGIIFILLDKWIKRADEKGMETVTNKRAIQVGLFQMIAVIPGVSRSAATIIGGLYSKLNKKAAAEFSFLLAVPTMLGATVKEFYDYFKDSEIPRTISHDEIISLIVGGVVAFLVAMVAIRILLFILRKTGFRYFGYYRIVVGLLILILIYSNVELHML